MALGNFPLDRALEVWFAAREELSPFAASPSELQHHKTQLEAANDDAVVSRLAILTPLGYDRVRKSEASKLGVRAEILDTEVARRRAELKQEHDVREVLATLHCPEIGRASCRERV